MWIHDFKNLIAHKKLWHAMTNIGAINSRHTKTYGVTKNHGLPWKFVTPCCQHHMENWIVINHKGQQYFQLINKWD
jgi:hypothetical protein